MPNSGDEIPLNDADYEHGAVLLSQAFRQHLLKQLVVFEFGAGCIHMGIGKTRIKFLTQPDWIPAEMKKAMESQGVRLITRVVDVETTP